MIFSHCPNVDFGRSCGFLDFLFGLILLLFGGIGDFSRGGRRTRGSRSGCDGFGERSEFFDGIDSGGRSGERWGESRKSAFLVVGPTRQRLESYLLGRF